jgi:ssDNA-binding replication factor A large subunit
MAEYEKFTFDQGSDIAVELELVDQNNNYKNLTNYDVNAQMKKNFNSDSSETTIFSAAVTDATRGILVLTLTNEQTSALKVGSYVYDVEISHQDSSSNTIIERVLEGKIRVSPNVTDAE